MAFGDNNPNDPDINVTMTCVEREMAWEEFLNGYLKNKVPLSGKEILEFLGSIQEYVYFDRPVGINYNPDQIFKAFDSMSRIAYFLAANKFLKRDSDPQDYVSKNLFLCISYLKRAETMIQDNPELKE